MLSRDWSMKQDWADLRNTAHVHVYLHTVTIIPLGALAEVPVVEFVIVQQEATAVPIETAVSTLLQLSTFSVTVGFKFASVLWRCWLGGRKGISPVKN